MDFVTMALRHHFSSRLMANIYHSLPFFDILRGFVGITLTQYDNTKNFKNLKNGELISLYNIPFIFEYFHDQQDSQWHEKASRRYQTKNLQNGQNVFFLRMG